MRGSFAEKKNQYSVNNIQIVKRAFSFTDLVGTRKYSTIRSHMTQDLRIWAAHCIGVDLETLLLDAASIVHIFDWLVAQFLCTRSIMISDYE